MRSIAFVFFAGAVLVGATSAHARAPADPAGPAEAPVLTLDEALQRAAQRHPNVRAAEALLAAAHARMQQARAGFLPYVTFSFAYQPQTANFAPTPGFKRALTRVTSGVDTVVDTMGRTITAQCVPPTGPNGPDLSVCQAAPIPPPLANDYALQNFWTAGVGVQWTVFDWGRTFYGWRAARTSESAARATVDTNALQVALDVKLAYFGALAADAQLAVAGEAVATQRKHVDQARAFFEVGSKTKIDVASAESDEAAAELTLARAHGAVEAARAALAAAIGEDEWHAVRLVAPPEQPDAAAPDEDAAFREALGARPELRDFALRARSLDDTARSLRGAYLPQLTFNFGPSWAGTDIGSLTTNLSATVALGYPLLGMNPFLIHGQMREARASRDALREQERGVANAVRLDVAQARAALGAARESVTAAGKLVAAARERRDLAEGRYQAGVGSILELSDAQLAFVNAEFQEISARLDLATARARLDHALGRKPY
jgi:outer membrane protein